MSDYCVGIDLGTTNTVCAVWERGSAAPEIIGIAQPVDFVTGEIERSRLLPSVLSIQEEGLFVGKAARQAWHLNRGKTFTSTKRNMGKPWISPTELDWTPERVAGAVLSVIHRELGQRYGASPLQVVITVPASFGTEARRATLQAARLAGFEAGTLRLFDEPTAALLAELKQNPEPSLDTEPRRIMMIDIGGGTLDVSLVALERDGGKTVFDVQGQSRLNTLAGDDFDLNIAGLLLERFVREREIDFKSLDRLSKIRLCSDILFRSTEVKERLSFLLRGLKLSEWKRIHEPVRISETPDRQPWRTDFRGDDLAAALVEYFPFDKSDDRDKSDTRRRRQEVTFFRPIQECLDAARLVTGEEVRPTEIWLAGGSAHLPVIPVAVQRFLDTAPRLLNEPMLAVALGAAWFSGLSEFGDDEMVIRERMFEGIYLQTSNQRFVEMVGAQERVPLKLSERPDIALTMPKADNRIEVDLFVGGDDSSENAREAERGLMPLARRCISFPEHLEKGQPISVDVEVTSNREVLLEFSTELNGEKLGGQVKASLAYGAGPDRNERPLPPINQHSVGSEG